MTTCSNIVSPKSRMSGLSRRQVAFVNEAHASGRWVVIVRRKGCAGVAEDDIDYIENLIVNEGLDKQIDAMWVNGQSAPTWHLGLTDGTPTAAASDTLASHPGWVEITNFDEAGRVVWTPGAISGQAVSNLASPARFTLNSNGLTIGGAIASDNATKGGTTGLLAAAGAFQAGDKLLDSGDTLDVTTQFSLSAP